MRRFICIATLLLVAGCQEAATTKTEAEVAPIDRPAEPVEVTETAFNTAGAPTVRIDVPDIMCESCVAEVKKALASHAGVADVMVSLEEKVATVAVDQETFQAEDAIALLVDHQFLNSKVVEEEGE